MGNWGDREHLVPGWTTLAERPVFKMQCNSVFLCIYTKGKFGICVQSEPRCCTREKPPHTPVEGT